MGEVKLRMTALAGAAWRNIVRPLRAQRSRIAARPRAVVMHRRRADDFWRIRRRKAMRAG